MNGINGTGRVNVRGQVSGFRHPEGDGRLANRPYDGYGWLGCGRGCEGLDGVWLGEMAGGARLASSSPTMEGRETGGYKSAPTADTSDCNVDPMGGIHGAFFSIKQLQYRQY